MPNAGSAAFTMPSLTLMPIFEYVPTAAAVGVPLNRPLVALKFAQEGLLRIEKTSILALESVVVGVKEYLCPATILVGALPEMVSRGAVGNDDCADATAPDVSGLPLPHPATCSNPVRSAATTLRRPDFLADSVICPPNLCTPSPRVQGNRMD